MTDSPTLRLYSTTDIAFLACKRCGRARQHCKD